MTEYAIGDIHSQEKGSGARANQGKPDWSLMPLDQVATLHHLERLGVAKITLEDLFKAIALFQQKGTKEQATVVLSHTVDYMRRAKAEEDARTLEEVLLDVLEVWEYGKRVYAAFNWMKGMPWSSVIACYVRHLLCLYRGEIYDQESGRHHGAHMICNAMMLVHFTEYYQSGNDLPTKWFQRETEHGNILDSGRPKSSDMSGLQSTDAETPG